MKKIIVTGGSGFIGSNLVDFLIKKKFFVINLDKLTYSSNKYQNSLLTHQHINIVILALGSSLSGLMTQNNSSKRQFYLLAHNLPARTVSTAAAPSSSVCVCLVGNLLLKTGFFVILS